METFNDVLAVALWVAIGSGTCSLFLIHTHAWHGRFSLDHDLQGVQKFHLTPVPRIGGVALVVGLVGGLLLGDGYIAQFSAPSRHSSPYLLLLAAMPVFLAGVVEDLTKKVRVGTRLGAAFASALAGSWLLGATIDSMDIWGVDALMAYSPVAVAVTALVVAGGTNAINIIDGFHGFAGSAVMIMLAGLGYLGWQHGDLLVVYLAAIGMAAVAGFLLLNYPTGKIFLGDGGAYLLGFWGSEVAVLLLVRNENVNAWQVLAICAYPIIEVLYSIYRRKIIQNTCPGQPDGLHLHTLLYQRVACKKIPFVVSKPWLRNASVASFVVVWTSVMALLAVTLGDTVFSAAMLVMLQVVLYMAVYRCLVRGQLRTDFSMGIRLVPDVRRQQ